MKDLVVLAADKNIEDTLKGLLTRHQSLDIRPINAQIYTEPGHDPACAQRGVNILSNFSKQYKYALLIFDYEGSGKEDIQPGSLQNKLNEEFSHSPWGDKRARTLVLTPELETWIWSDSPHVDDVTGWKERQPGLRSWLIEQGWLRQGEHKPERPKEAFEAALREARIPRSSSLYLKIASKVSLERCTDNSFREFRKILQNWFG